MDYYTSEKINDHITLIRSRAGELLYLIQGSQKAALIDTCVGIGHLKAYVSRLTDKPVTVLLTHGHVDHAMGAPEFEEVYMNLKDLPVYQKQCCLEERMGYIGACLGPAIDEVDPAADLVPSVPDYIFRPLDHGDSFDLGGIHIDACALYGHTPGCMVFLIREDRILILGDACCNSTFLFTEESLPLARYRENLKAARDYLTGRYDRVFLSHHDMETGCDIMDNVLEVIDEVMAGGGDNLPYDFMGYKAYIAKDCNECFQRRDGKCGNIIYPAAR